MVKLLRNPVSCVNEILAINVVCGTDDRVGVTLRHPPYCQEKRVAPLFPSWGVFRKKLSGADFLSGIRLIARSASAVIVRAGLTPTLAEIAAPSTT